MLAWLHILQFLDCANWVPELDVQPALCDNALKLIFSELEFIELYQASYVSKNFRKLAYAALKPFYGIEHKEKIYLSYTKILWKLDAQLEGAKGRDDAVEAHKALMTSPHCVCVLSILKAEFGHCINYAKPCSPRFSLYEPSFEILSDEHRISVLPFVLDHMHDQYQWIAFIRRLLKLERIDLLHQLTFANISTCHFTELMGVSLPQSVVATAAWALQMNERSSELSHLLASAGFWYQRATLPDTCQIPLFMLCYLHKRGVQIPKGCMVVFKPTGATSAFWNYMQSMEASNAKRLLRLILEHGDGDAKSLAGILNGTVPSNDAMFYDTDFWQAVIIRLYFGPLCQESVTPNVPGQAQKVF